MIKRYRYKIKGCVQGVGFRPFIYRIANTLDIIGFVKNNNFGVLLEIEGSKDKLDKFDLYLKNDLPPLAKIETLEKEEIPPLYKGQFEIVLSEFQSSLSSLKIASVPPDIAICKDCKIELKSLKKYKDYFSTNCTNCGPRYSIIQTVPYDRENTSMQEFILCKSCFKEYKNPSNRRYHAQAISCNDCGPKLNLTIKNKNISSSNIYKDISKLIKDGKIGAIKALGGFHIVCDATNDIVIKKLREYKNRPTKPFAIICKDIEQISTIATISSKEKEILLSKEAPIVLLNSKQNSILSSAVAPNINRIGCMLPYSAFYYLLFEFLENPIIATSANLSGEPIILSKDQIEQKLPFVDFIVDYNRDIVNGVDDSVVQIVDGDIQILRLARGYAPQEIKLLKKISKKILAFGANQKSTISLAFDDKLILSPYIGDLDSLESVEYFQRTIDTFKKFYDFDPDIIVCDKHKGYESTKIAKTFSKEIKEVQHHLAHLYSVKAEHNLSGNFVGFIFDGTGAGDDATLWGGEVFVNDKRKYHFKPIKLLGGSKAIKECKRVALSLLFDRYSLDHILDMNLPTIDSFSKVEIKLLYNMWSKNLNSPSSSSVGRLFDAIASFAGVSQIQSYEGEAGLLCEMNYDKDCKKSFEYNLENNIIDIEYNFFDTNIISRFINTLAKIVIDISKKEDLPIILSGGVFQNKTLLELIINECKKEDIKYYYNKTIPTNDSGISVGQIWSRL